MQRQIEQLLRKAWEVSSVAAKRFLQIDGTHWAAAFAFNAVFSLFPLIILFVTLAAFFVDRENAGQAIITYAEGYVPLDGAMRDRIFGSISKVIDNPERQKEIGLRNYTAANGLPITEVVDWYLIHFEELLKKN